MKNYIFILLFLGGMIGCSDNQDSIALDINEEKAIESTFNSNIIRIDGLTINLDSINVNDTINMFTELSIDDRTQFQLKDSRSSRSLINDDYKDNIQQLLNLDGVYLKVREGSGSARFLAHQGAANKELTLKPLNLENRLLFTFHPKRAPLTGEIYFESTYVTVKFDGKRPPKIETHTGIVSAGKNNSSKNILYLKSNNSLTGSIWNISASSQNLDNSGSFIFYNTDLYGGGSNYWDTYNLCLQGNGTNLEFAKYTQKGSQEFEIIPIGEFEMVKLDLFTDNTSFAVKKPDFMVKWTYNNNSDLVQNMSTKFGKKASFKSSFSRKHSVSISATSTLKVGGAFMSEAGLSVTTSNTNEWSFGEEESREDSREYNFPLSIDKRERIEAFLYVSQYEMNLKYKAVYREKTTGKYYTEIGAWQGVDCTDIVVDVQRYDAAGNLKSQTKFNSIPKSRVL